MGKLVLHHGKTGSSEYNRGWTIRALRAGQSAHVSSSITRGRNGQPTKRCTAWGMATHSFVVVSSKPERRIPPNVLQLLRQRGRIERQVPPVPPSARRIPPRLHPRIREVVAPPSLRVLSP
jgi:hypothetical protein